MTCHKLPKTKIPWLSILPSLPQDNDRTQWSCQSYAGRSIPREVYNLSGEALSTQLPPSTEPADPLQGTKGWLMFFCIIATLGSLRTMGAAMDSAARHAYVSVAFQIIWIAGTMTCVLCVLRNQGLNFIRRWFTGVWITGTLIGILGILLRDTKEMGAGLGCLVLGLGWGTYFRNSKRVHATFESD
jgi:hypothetical protein